MGSQGRITERYQAQYPNPIRLSRGDAVSVGRHDTDYPGWIWCLGPDGREGWVPESFLQILGRGTAEVLRDYDARELSVEPGCSVAILQCIGGWCQVRDEDGRIGWVPETHVRQVHG